LRPHDGWGPPPCHRQAEGGYRPICVGECFRRLAGKAVIRATSVKFSTIFGSSQLGVGAELGVERAAHLVRRAIQFAGPDRVTARVDIRNALNSLLWEVILLAVQANLPEIFAFVSWLYGAHSPLFLKAGVYLTSESGIQQGDPLGPLLFALGIQGLVDQISKIDGIDTNVWTADDGCISDTPAAVAQAIALLEREFPKLVLELAKDGKCEIIGDSVATDPPTSSPGEGPLFPAYLTRVTPQEATHLSVPLGSEEHAQAFVHERLLIKNDLDSCLEGLLELHQPQIALFILRSCLSFGKIVNWLRTVPPKKTLPFLERWDRTLLHALSDILAVPSSDILGDASRQIQLPLVMGGWACEAPSTTQRLATSLAFDAVPISTSTNPQTCPTTPPTCPPSSPTSWSSRAGSFKNSSPPLSTKNNWRVFLAPVPTWVRKLGSRTTNAVRGCGPARGLARWTGSPGPRRRPMVRPCALKISRRRWSSAWASL